MLMSMMLVTYLVRGAMDKALMMLGLGLVLGTVGMDPITGRDRFTYNLMVLKKRHWHHPDCDRSFWRG